MPSRNVVYVKSNIAQTVALSFILKCGVNQVLWERCQFLWDSYDQAEKCANTDQMAIFGIKGKIQTPEMEEFDFTFLHTFDYSQAHGYGLFVSVSNSFRQYNESLLVRVNDLLSDGEEQEHFTKAVTTLTKQFAGSGFDKTLKSSLTL